jgi:hypothetical protein
MGSDQERDEVIFDVSPVNNQDGAADLYRLFDDLGTNVPDLDHSVLTLAKSV